jgi:glycosyltransferase involved in cell wall biosynthesis
MSSSQQLPVSVVIPTRDRTAVLIRTLESLLSQDALPYEIIVVDSSQNFATRDALAANSTIIHWIPSIIPGAAVQRNLGLAAASQSVIAFLDDDILLQPHCFKRLWDALHSGPKIGGVNAMISNQRYQSPGRFSRFMFRLIGGTGGSFAGRVLGPAVNLLPEDRDDLPDTVPVEWLNTTCTLYRREALPDPPFPSHFTGYSLMEDLTLSATVARQWKLFNARTARIFHDSQPGSHKSDPVALAEMELLNRYYVTTQVLGRRGFRMLMKLALWESFQLLSLVRSTPSPGLLARTLWGKIRAIPRCYQMREQSLSNP